jgi:hypothetical protein
MQSVSRKCAARAIVGARLWSLSDGRSSSPKAGHHGDPDWTALFTIAAAGYCWRLHSEPARMSCGRGLSRASLGYSVERRKIRGGGMARAQGRQPFLGLGRHWFVFLG